MKNIEVQKPVLDLEWVAIHDDGIAMKQNYNLGRDQGEKDFGDIRLDELKEFWLEDKQGNRRFGIILETQTIHINGLNFKVEFPRSKDGKIVSGKLVYFRRIRQDFIPDMATRFLVRYCIGLQANIDGTNYQQFVFIGPEGYTLSQKK